MVSQLQVALEQKAVKLLNDKRLLNELAAYMATYNAKTGTVTYNAPQGLHDDTVMSTLLAFHNYKNHNDYVQYQIAFARNKQAKRV